MGAHSQCTWDQILVHSLPRTRSRATVPCKGATSTGQDVPAQSVALRALSISEVCCDQTSRPVPGLLGSPCRLALPTKKKYTNLVHDAGTWHESRAEMLEVRILAAYRYSPEIIRDLPAASIRFRYLSGDCTGAQLPRFPSACLSARPSVICARRYLWAVLSSIKTLASSSIHSW